MQTPLHRFAVGSVHVPPHIPAVQVAVPFVTIAHGSHDEVPQFAGLVSSTHLPLQLWKPVAQATWQRPPTQAAVPCASVGQVMHDVPQALASSSFRQRSPQAW
jgi:hypothetical protein